MDIEIHGEYRTILVFIHFLYWRYR